MLIRILLGLFPINDNSLMCNVGDQLKYCFSYFTLTNFENDKGESSISDLNTFYTEQNIRWQAR